MNSNWIFRLAIVAIVALAGCDSQSTAPDPVDDAAQALREIDQEIADFEAEGADAEQELTGVSHGKGHRNRNFIANLSGRQEVPPNDSKGRGVAKFKVSKDGDSISYKLIVANIKNVVAAHIHKGVKGVNGPVVLGLYSAPAGGGRINGTIAKGWFSPADLVGPYAGSTDFDLFLQDLHGDSLYVNVHTNDGVDSTSGGPGDLPGGEIRGQLKGHGQGHKGKGPGHGHGNGNGNGHGNGRQGP